MSAVYVPLAIVKGGIYSSNLTACDSKGRVQDYGGVYGTLVYKEPRRQTRCTVEFRIIEVAERRKKPSGTSFEIVHTYSSPGRS